MRTVILGSIVVALVGCGGGGSDGPLEPNQQPQVPTAAELVPEAIPYDSIGSQSIYFTRALGGIYYGFVRLNGGTGNATVYAPPSLEFGTTVSRSGEFTAFWCFACPNGYFGNAGDAIMVRRLGAATNTAVRVSSDAISSRSEPAWSTDGQFVYWLERANATGGSADRVRLVRQSRSAGAAIPTIIAETAPICLPIDRAAPAVAGNGDVAFSITLLEGATTCRPVVFRWNTAAGTLQQIANFSGALAWSPEGTRLVVLREFSPNIVTVMNADGSNAAVIYSGVQTSASVTGVEASVCWGVDAGRIFFTYYNASFEARVWSVRPDGSQPMPITSPTPKASGIAADGDISCAL